MSDDGADTAGSEGNGEEETERSGGEGETETGETTDKNEEDCSSQSAHIVHFDSVEDSVDEDATVCEFDDLPSGAQVEVETARHCHGPIAPGTILPSSGTTDTTS